MKPYYEQDGITIYHGDCREVLPSLPGRSVDAVVTDPPYGLDLGVANNQSKGGGHLAKGAYATYQDTYENFVRVIVPRLTEALAVAQRGAVFTGPHIQEQPKAMAIGGIYHPAATGRTPWGSKNFLPILLYGQHPNAGRHRPTVLCTAAVSPENGHPCPKPLEWMEWLIELVTLPGETILDPFMGSGTTLEACKAQGRRAIGIEIEERYCEIAAKRLAQGVLFGLEASA